MPIFTSLFYWWSSLIDNYAIRLKVYEKLAAPLSAFTVCHTTGNPAIEVKGRP